MYWGGWLIVLQAPAAYRALALHKFSLLVPHTPSLSHRDRLVYICCSLKWTIAFRKDQSAFSKQKLVSCRFERSCWFDSIKELAQ
jgi:hypothetical protein